MSFIAKPFDRELGHIKTWYNPSNTNPAPAPAPPNPNDAQNAARVTSDQMRARRGLLANVYAGASNTQPTTGKVQLGT